MPEELSELLTRLRSRLRPTVVLLPTADYSARLALARRTAFVVARAIWTTILGLMRDVLVGEYDGATRHTVRREVAIPELVDEVLPRAAIRLRLPWRIRGS